MKLLIHSQTSTAPPLILGIDKYFHPTLYNGCYNLSMLRMKLIHLSKRWILLACGVRMITPGARFNVFFNPVGRSLASWSQTTPLTPWPRSRMPCTPLGIQVSLNRRHTPHIQSQSEGDTPKHSHIGGTYQHTSPVHFHTALDHCD